MATDQVKTLLDGVSSVSDGTLLSVSVKGIRGMYGVAQCRITGAATVVLQGRLSSAYSWADIKTFSGDEIVEVVLCPEMRGRVTAISSGTASLAIIGDNT